MIFFNWFIDDLKDNKNKTGISQNLSSLMSNKDVNDHEKKWQSSCRNDNSSNEWI